MEEITNLFKLDIPTVLVGLVVILIAVKYIISLIEWFFNRFGIQSKWKTNKQKEEDEIHEISERLDTIGDQIENINEKLDNTTAASREALGDRINQKYKYYLKIEGVPEDEVDEFVALHDAYKGVGGNHSGDAKFEYCMNNLDIIPVTNKLNYSEKEV